MGKYKPVFESGGVLWAEYDCVPDEVCPERKESTGTLSKTSKNLSKYDNLECSRKPPFKIEEDVTERNRNSAKEITGDLQNLAEDLGAEGFVAFAITGSGHEDMDICGEDTISNCLKKNLKKTILLQI